MAAHQEKKNSEKKPPRFIALTGIALQMGITIFLFAELGKFLDEKFTEEKSYFKIGLTLMGVVVSFYNLMRQVNKLNDKEDQ